LRGILTPVRDLSLRNEHWENTSYFVKHRSLHLWSNLLKAGYKSENMKRDMDLVRDLLIEMDNDPQLDGLRWVPGENIAIKDHSAEEIAYHLSMLIEAGYVAGKTTMNMPVINKLTWQGHELLDDIRDPDIWTKTKERAKGVAGIGVTLIWEIAKGELKKKLGI
jgi:hypothetical protein